MQAFEQQQQEDTERRLLALQDLRAIQQRCKIAAMLCATDDDWLTCLRAIAFDVQNWEQEHGAL